MPFEFPTNIDKFPRDDVVSEYIMKAARWLRDKEIETGVHWELKGTTIDRKTNQFSYVFAPMVPLTPIDRPRPRPSWNVGVEIV